MNLQEALQELGEPLSEVMAYAKKQDIRAEAESRVKDLADSMNLTSIRNSRKVKKSLKTMVTSVPFDISLMISISVLKPREDNRLQVLNFLWVK